MNKQMNNIPCMQKHFWKFVFCPLETPSKLNEQNNAKKRLCGHDG